MSCFQIEISGLLCGVPTNEYIEDNLGMVWIDDLELGLADGKKLKLEFEENTTTLLENGNLLFTMQPTASHDLVSKFQQTVKIENVSLNYDCDIYSISSDYYHVEQVALIVKDQMMCLPGEILDEYNGMNLPIADLDIRAVGDLGVYDQFDGMYEEGDLPFTDVEYYNEEDVNEREPF